MHAGHPSAPSLTVIAVDFQSFKFTIFPLLEHSQCVLYYNITPTRRDGHVLPDIIIESGGSVSATVSGYDVCIITYSFTAVAVTSSAPGERSNTVNSDYLSKYSVAGNFEIQEMQTKNPFNELENQISTLSISSSDGPEWVGCPKLFFSLQI